MLNCWTNFFEKIGCLFYIVIEWVLTARRLEWAFRKNLLRLIPWYSPTRLHGVSPEVLTVTKAESNDICLVMMNARNFL